MRRVVDSEKVSSIRSRVSFLHFAGDRVPILTVITIDTCRIHVHGRESLQNE